MAPQQHLAWFKENAEWFGAIPASQLNVPVPNCPGWVIADVLTHLSRGLGLAYPVAMAAAPDTPSELVFSTVAWPTSNPTGQAVIDEFSANLAACIGLFEAADPNDPCWTYGGPGHAGFWFRRAAIETALHRFDVEQALATSSTLEPDRARDAILETLEFALPFAAATTNAPSGPLRVESSELELQIDVGSNDAAAGAKIAGTGQAILCALWGRQPSPPDPSALNISGDANVADEWLTLVERAFAGR